jgi:DNA-binding IclR family transcriptional regulator
MKITAPRSQARTTVQLFGPSAFTLFLRTVVCSPVGASKIASALKLPRVTVVRRLQEMVKQGYVERLGNAYVVTDKVNIPDLKNRLQRRIDMIMETAKKLSEVGASAHHLK